MPWDAALYYPRIRIQDTNWLKITLLCFGRVCRITPDSYVADDSDIVKECCETEGPNGALVGPAKLWDPPVQKELLRLRDKINSADEKVVQRFTREALLQSPGGQFLADSFEIHRMKVDPLVQTLLDRKLGWFSRAQRGQEWIALNPELGNVVMSRLAIAIAENEGLSIVTPILEAHTIATSLEEELLLETLLGGQFRKPLDNAADLIQVLMRSVVYNVSTMSIQKIVKLLNEKEDLISLRVALESIASTIPPMENKDRRSKLVREAAVEAILEWQKDNPSRKGQVVEISANLYEIGEAAVELHFLKAAIKTVTFLFKLAKGAKDSDQSKNKYKFLNLVDQSGNPGSSTLMLPAFGKLA